MCISEPEDCNDKGCPDGEICNTTSGLCEEDEGEDEIVECTYEYTEEVQQFNIVEDVDNSASAYSAIANDDIKDCQEIIEAANDELADNPSNKDAILFNIAKLGCSVKIVTTIIKLPVTKLIEHIKNKNYNPDSYLIENPNGSGEKIAPTSCKKK